MVWFPSIQSDAMLVDDRLPASDLGMDCGTELGWRIARHGAMSAMIQRIHRVPLQGRASESVAPVDSDRLSLHCGRAFARVTVIQH
jgi:hypothetical protein